MIRLLEEKDIDEVMEIWLNTNISAHYFIPEKYWIGNYHAIKGDYLPKAENYVFVEDNTIKGFISIMENSFIGALFVGLEYQKYGIGKKLVEYCKNIYDVLHVAVYVDNESAIEFYRKSGFTTVREQINSDSKFKEYIMEWVK